MKTDYLIVGSGAVGMAFADTLLEQSDAHITIVDRKTVDAKWFSPSVPSTHKPQFTIADGVRVIAPNGLPQLWLQHEGRPVPQKFCIPGAGKTAMDAAVWLLRNGANPTNLQPLQKQSQ